MQWVASGPLRLVYWINHGADGWSESWHLRETNENYALGIAKDLVQARSWLLATGLSIEFAVIRLDSPPWWHWAVTQGPPIDAIADPGFWGPVDTDWVGVHFGMRTDDGEIGKKLFRGVADTEIVDKKWIRKNLTLPAGIPAKPADPLLATKDQLWRYALCLFRDHTCHIEPLPPTPKISKPFLFRTWAKIFYNGVLRRAVGSRADRQSWECDVYANSPNFSPCGEVINVSRRAFSTECRFYVNGPLVRINFYWAKAGATVFPHKTIFIGRHNDKAIDNQFGSGEVTGPSHRQWHQGYSFGDAPADHFCGEEQLFLGKYIRPWNPPVPTPLNFLCDCDMPVPLPIRVDLSDNSVFDPNTTHITFDVADFSMDDPVAGHVVIHAKCGCHDPCTADCNYWVADSPVQPVPPGFSLNLAQFPLAPSDQKITIPGNVINGQFTFVGWLKVNSGAAAQLNLGASDPASGPFTYFTLLFTASTSGMQGFFEWASDSLGLAYECATPSTPSSLGWHMVAFTFDYNAAAYNQMKFYFDGVFIPNDGETFFSGYAPSNPYSEFSLYGQGQPFAAVGIYHHVLTPSEIALLFSSPSFPGGEHVYQINEGQGYVIHDNGSNPLPGYIPYCLGTSPNPCLKPTGALKYGGVVIGGQVMSLGEPITEIVSESF